MSKTIKQLHDEYVNKYHTNNNSYDDFPVGTRVKIITPCQDFHFFYGEEGIVVDNKKEYLGIEVRYDKPRHYEDGTIETGFNFNPKDLWKIPEKEIPRYDLLDFD